MYKRKSIRVSKHTEPQCNVVPIVTVLPPIRSVPRTSIVYRSHSAIHAIQNTLNVCSYEMGEMVFTLVVPTYTALFSPPTIHPNAQQRYGWAHFPNAYCVASLPFSHLMLAS